MSLEDLEKKLYDLNPDQEGSTINLQKQQIKNRTDNNENSGQNFKNTWDDQKIEINSNGQKSGFMNNFGRFIKSLFWILLGVVLIGGGFVYLYLHYFSKASDLNFTLNAPDKVMLAQPFDISVSITNKSQNAMNDSKFIITLPEGVISLDNQAGGKQTIEEDIGNMNGGETFQKDYKVVILQDPQTVKEFDVDFSYVPQNLKTRFERTESIKVNVDQPAIDLNFMTPQKIFSGQDFQINVNYNNSSDANFENAKIRLTYPQGFVFKQATVAPTSSNNVWVISQISPNSQNSFVITGSLPVSDQTFFQAKADVIVNYDNQDYTINEKTADLNIAASPISLGLAINNDPNYIAALNNTLNYQVSYGNNTDVALNDAVVKIKLKGDMFDFSTLKTDGNFDSTSNTITWNAGNDASLKSLAPGSSSQINFSINTKSTFPIKRMFDKNFVLSVQGEIDSPTVPYNVSSDKTVGLADLETKISGAIEPSEYMKVIKGPYPPEINKPTVYEVHWLLKNYSTDISNVNFTGTLQGAQWLNVVTSNVNSIPQYDDRTGQVTWNIDKVLATRGVISSPVEAVFQIQITPNVTQSGQSLLIMSPVSVTATDTFTNLSLNSSIDNLKTNDSVK